MRYRIFISEIPINITNLEYIYGMISPPAVRGDQIGYTYWAVGGIIRRDKGQDAACYWSSNVSHQREFNERNIESYKKEYWIKFYTNTIQNNFTSINFK